MPLGEIETGEYATDPKFSLQIKIKKKQRTKSAQIASIMESITTVHGTSHFASKTGKPLMLCVAAMIGNVLLTIAFIMVIKQKFNNNQIVTVINANCNVNQVPFPSVSICNFNMVSLKESKNIENVLKHCNKTDKEIISFFNALPHLKNFGKDSRELGNFSDMMSILKHHYFTMDTIMEEVHQKCENLLLHCSFNRKQKNCNDMFSLVKTYEGHCCIFNYAALNDASEVPLLPLDNNLEYYDDDSPTARIISTSESGRMSGLSVVFNVEPHDYPVWANVPYYGAKILISDPKDYPETTILYRYITPGQSVDIKVEPMDFQSDSDIRRVEPDKRACWFHDEVNLGHTDRYSYETCHTECKMKNYLDTCGCVPYKYPREKSIRICEFEDLKCLNNVTVYTSANDMPCYPLCYMECRDQKYRITSDLSPFLSTNYQGVTQGVNGSELAALKVYYGKSTCNCYKLSLLVDVNYFIATYGGVFSLSFGGSVITLVELTYLFVSFVMAFMLRAINVIISTARLSSLK